MRVVSKILILSLMVGAFAAQAAECGRTVAEVRAIMKKQGMATGKLNKFKGTWVYGSDVFSIGETTPLKSGSYSLKVCPQSDGTLYVYTTGGIGVGNLVRSGNTMSVGGYVFVRQDTLSAAN